MLFAAVLCVLVAGSLARSVGEDVIILVPDMVNVTCGGAQTFPIVVKVGEFNNNLSYIP